MSLENSANVPTVLPADTPKPTVPLTISEVKMHLIANKFIFPTAQSYQSFESGSKGFHTYGPLGISLKNKIIQLWRREFVTNDVYEIDTPLLQSKEVLTNSGHVGKFNDLVISNGIETVRADHLVKDFCEVNKIKLDKPIDNFTKEELLEIVKQHKMIQNSENATIAPKNLMFNFGDLYLRPEIAQGMFTEFDQFYETLSDLPFGLAQVGKSYRNEISPQPFVRLREFTQAEVEYFFDPHNEVHPRFDTVAHLNIPLLTQDIQLSGSEDAMMFNISEAVNSGVVVNQIMGYYLCTAYKFARMLGLDNSVIRFRQHLPNELAHYARQCWDLEILLANGHWLECLGLAHRGDFDLRNHNIKGQNVIKEYETKTQKIKLNINPGEPKDVQKKFYTYFKNKVYDSEEDLQLDPMYDDFRGNTTIVSFTQINPSTVFPYVIEPSMGIDRMIYAVSNNLLKKRSDDLSRVVFTLPLSMTPYQIAIYALSNKDNLVEYVTKNLSFLHNYFSVFTDFSSVSIGKKYVRSDAIGVGLTITVDFDTINKDHGTFDTVTLRNSIDKTQIRIHVRDIVNVVSELIEKSKVRY